MFGENPYYHRGPIRESEHFYDRTQETERTLQMIRNGQSVSVVGPRRIGKTSFLFHLSNSQVRAAKGFPDEEAQFVYIDGEVLVGMEELEVLRSLFQETAIRVRGAREAVIPIVDYCSFDHALQELARSRKQLVYLIDEFEYLARNERLSAGFFSFLRSLAMQRGVVYVVASAMPLSSLVSDRAQSSSPFFNFFAPLYLGLFSDVDARRLIREPSQAAGIVFSPEMEDYILDLAGPHPFFLQIACYHAFELVRECVPLEGEQGREELAKRVRQEMKPHFQYFVDRLNEMEKQALAYILEAGADECPRSVVEGLEQKCLVRQSGDKLLPLSRAFADFVREHFDELIGPTWTVAVPEGDRRMATVLFVDVVGSTSLAERHVPEDFYAIIREALGKFADIVDRYGGKIADFGGDSMMVLFGVPTEQPDDATRAIQAALETLNAAAHYARELEQRKGIRFGVRIGLNTGVVILGRIGGKQRAEYTALGEAVNLAKRLQELAQPDTVLISEHTYQQVRGRFEVKPLGAAMLKGITRPVETYQVLREKAPKTLLPS